MYSYNKKAVRYHSWVVDRELPECLEEIAWTEDEQER